MTKKTLKTLVTIVGVFGVFLPMAHADTLISKTGAITSDLYISNSTSHDFIATAVASGTPATFLFYVSQVGDGFIRVSVNGGPNQSGVTYCESSNLTITTTGYYTASCSFASATVSKNSSYYVNFTGDTAGSPSTGIHIGTDGSVPYFIIYDSGGSSSSSNTTRFIAPYTPPDLTVSTSTSVAFSVPYFFNDTTSFGVYDTVSLRITDISTGEVRDLPPFTIDASGGETYFGTASVVYAHQYLWQPRMYLASDPTQYLLGDISTLWGLAISTTSESLNTAALAGTVGTSSLPSATNFLSFLNVPYLLTKKVPFAYFFEIKDGLIQGLQSSSTTAVPAGTISFKIGPATTTVDFFSTSTVGYFLNPTLVSLWRGFLVALLYIEFGYVLYNRAKSKHLL